jgi:hypothetical protein
MKTTELSCSRLKKNRKHTRFLFIETNTNVLNIIKPNRSLEMKKIIALTLALVSVSAFAINTSRTWQSGLDRMKITGYQTTGFKYESKQEAVNGALALYADLTSGSPAKASMAKLRNAHILWDDDKCQSTFSNARKIVREMAKGGKSEVISIKVGSHFTGSGEEVFNYTMRFYETNKF